MGVLLPLILLQLVKLCVIAFAFTVLGSAGHNIQPSPAKFSVISPVEGTPGPIHHRKSLRSLAPSSASDPNGSNLHPPHAIPPILSTPMPRIFEGLAPSLSPSTPIEVPPYNTAPPPLVLHDHVPSLPPIPPLLTPPSSLAPPPSSSSLPPIPPLLSPPSSLAPPPSSSPRTPVNFLPPSSLPVLSPPPNTTPPPSSSPRTLVIPNSTPPSSLRRTPVLSPPPTTTPPPSSSPRTLVIISPPPDTTLPSSSPRTPILSPPPTTTPPPSSSPRTLVISPPPTTTHPPSLSPVISPPPTTTPPPSSSPRTPVISPPPNTTPPPSSSAKTLVIISPPPDTTPPSSSQRTPVLSPPPTTTPPPSSSPRTPVISPPPTTTHPPSFSPRTPVISPPPTTNPSPSSSPRTLVISPPPSTTPPPSSSPRTLVIISPPPNTTPPSWSRRTPVLSPPPITTPPPSSSPRTLVMVSPPPNTTPPSSSPRAPVLSPPPTTTPPPSSSPRTPVISPPPITTHPPSSSQRTPVISPPPTTTPPPSSSPRTPVISPPPPPNTTPPPSSSSRTPVISPALDTTPLPSLTPKLPVVSPPPNTAPPPSMMPKTPVVLPPSYLVPPPSSMPKIPISSPPSSTPTNPIVSPPSNLAPPPSLTLTTPVISSPSNSAPPPFTIEGLVPSTVPSAPPRKSTVSVPGAPVATPSRNSPQNSPSSYPSIPGALPPISDVRNASNNMAPIIEPVAPVPVSSPTSKFPRNSSAFHRFKPGESPSVLPDLDIPPASSPTTSFDRNKDGIPVSEPPHEMLKPLPPVSHSPTKGPSAQQSMGHPDARVPPLSSPRSPPNKGHHSQASSPSTSFPKQHHASNRVAAPASLYFISPTASTQPGPVIQPGRGDRVPPPLYPVNHVSPAPSPAPLAAPSQTEKSPKMPVLPPILALPPPPPNGDCSTTVCTEPYTNTPPGVPCGCVLPMQVGLRLSVALYTFFPLVSELAAEIAAGVFMKPSQVRIMGADAASQQPEKTVVLVDLVPLGEKFNKTTAFLTYQRFWHKQVVIQSSFFGDYEVLYVRYPGLPPSPPSASSGIGKIDNGPYSSNGNNATMKPEGVDVPNRRQSYGVHRGMVVIIVLSAFVAVVVSSAIAWVLLFKYRGCVSQSAPVLGHFQQSHAKPLGAARSMTGSGLESAPISFGSSIATYMGSAKTFSTSDIERATGNFDASRILGEGGFGLVYSGVLEDGTKVAVKVLKRDDQQGGREFLAEVEMLSRLHHRNLVKLIGICIEKHARCLVYELIPNGSVESHLHGVDKESAPLGWDARLKIALGAARGLAYLHEDSSPRVIHRDFKSSNILLEHDFTPKVSDFGLARTAMDEANTHISTRVMGTFGYVAPEYAMTGHLLVKSDVYSYGVVLLELLTGRKPVEMTQLPGQENLVAWARPFLTSRDGLEMIIDKSLGDDVPFDCVAKVAAIASMCVQPEVTHRPFMGEVVQALNLVCNEFDEGHEAKEQELGSRSSSRDDLFIDFDPRVGTSSGHLPDPLQSQHSVPNYDLGIDTEKGGLPVSNLFSSLARYGGKDESGLVTRYSSSGPLRTGNGRQFWQTIRRLSTGTVSEEHSHALRLRPGSH